MHCAVMSQELDIGAIVSQRLTAMRKLQENPNDVQAISEMYRAQKGVSMTVSKQFHNGGCCVLRPLIRCVMLPADADVGWIKAAARSVYRYHRCSSAHSCRACIWLPSMGQEGTQGHGASYGLCVLGFPPLCYQSVTVQRELARKSLVNALCGRGGGGGAHGADSWYNWGNGNCVHQMQLLRNLELSA